MVQIKCKILSTSGCKEGVMFNQKDFTFENLINWVHRNCPGADKVEIDNNSKNVSAIYDERYEIYSLEEKQCRVS